MTSFLKRGILYNLILISMLLLLATSCDTSFREAAWLHGRWVHYEGNIHKTGPTKDGWIFHSNGDAIWHMTDTQETLLECSYTVNEKKEVLVKCPGYQRAEIYRQYQNKVTLINDTVGAIWHKE
jgi:hypothetical protein